MSLVVNSLSLSYPLGIGPDIVNTVYVKIVGYNSLSITLKSVGRIDIVYTFSHDGINALEDNTILVTNGQLTQKIPVKALYVKYNIYSLDSSNSVFYLQTLAE